MARVKITDLQRMKAEKKKIVVMTAYDYSMAGILEAARKSTEDVRAGRPVRSSQNRSG
jgi:ketopantoate hydroxymethyltransferase